MDQPQKPRVKSSTNNRYHPPPGDDPQPYQCNLCTHKFASHSTLKRHFHSRCYATHNFPKTAKWDDHPSALTPLSALALPCARPFYPTYKTSTPTKETLTWPLLSAWPTNPADLERKNAAHRVIEGSNPHFVDTRENVYADVAGDADEFVSGEGPWTQLGVLWQCVDARGVRGLLEGLQNGGWVHGFEDDVFLALGLHCENERLGEWFGLSQGEVRRGMEQAGRNFFGVHVRAVAGPNEVRREAVGVQEERWRGLIGRFRGEHVEVGCEGCDRIRDAVSEFMVDEGDESGDDDDNGDDGGDREDSGRSEEGNALSVDGPASGALPGKVDSALESSSDSESLSSSDESGQGGHCG